MMKFEDFKRLIDETRAAGKKVIAVSKTLLADHTTPLMAYKALGGNGVPSALLESVRQGKDVGRFSVVAARPFLRFSVYGDYSLEEKLSHGDKVKTNKPLEHLADLLACYTPFKKDIYFNGGAVGYMGYESVRLVETTVPRNGNDDLSCPDILFYFFRQLVIFDHAFQKLHLVINEIVDEDTESMYKKVSCRLDGLEKAITRRRVRYKAIRPAIDNDPINSNMAKEVFMGIVREAKKYIEKGDVFQVVLSQRFQRSFPAGLSLDFYRLLRHINPSPYLFHINFGNGFKMAGASPEVMIEIKDEKIHIRPIAGTRKRGKTAEEDGAMAEDLRNDPKEIAEHKMLVDLARNDAGRYSEFGSITIPEIMKVENYSHVMHMVTSVYGRLRKEFSSLEACLGCLPAGTLSGCPKIKAMEIIARLEPSIRG
ncbi:MAG: chorismate-binding protein, partial [Patescibacteria group bacterium]